MRPGVTPGVSFSFATSSRTPVYTQVGTSSTSVKEQKDKEGSEEAEFTQ